ncbi:hypothetical protein DT019_03175 [Streptomyces sp. SDr-06]|uniref:hypothetical protein n=1 Tax=Streptomyces sp. SDr-06 TaxID=2267702 RepID=UPI000DEACFF6|nr:hypothetical protein [Streptomyces sp. SDr-06]RCH70506.1 hypothetical protein DT019_03175 [Streptomyces sp. SDr-06]
MTDTSPTAELGAAAERIRIWLAEEPAQPWSPGALATFGPELADWFDFEAGLIEVVPGSELPGRTLHALAVARQILGSPS